MKVFIDTNILLDFYHLSGADLEELKKVIKLIEVGKIELLLNQQVVDEFYRNRERVIADAIRRFKETKALQFIPNVVREYPKTKELMIAITQVNAAVKEIAEDLTEDIKNSELKADGLIEDLFDAVAADEISIEIIDDARVRVDLGNPPGKKGELGDAINWEWLLTQDLKKSDKSVVIVSNDVDFESELTKGQIREFLNREWEDENPDCELLLSKSLTDFMKAYFPEIKLADEIDKISRIEKFENAGNFAATHKAVAALLKSDDFNDAEIIRILKTFENNEQVKWILGDADVKAFALKIIGLAKSDQATALAQELKAEIVEEDPEAD